MRTPQPSPTADSAEKRPWSPRRLLPSSTRTSCETPPSTGEIEPFSISRESFDSYRRSFVRFLEQPLNISSYAASPTNTAPHEQDVSAKSPIHHDPPPRQSLDSARIPRAPRSSHLLIQEPTTEEEAFEDVGLDEPAAQPRQQANPGGRRRGIFSMFSEGADSGGGSPVVSRFLAGRRNQSGQGAELRRIEEPEGGGLRSEEAGRGGVVA